MLQVLGTSFPAAAAAGGGCGNTTPQVRTHACTHWEDLWWAVMIVECGTRSFGDKTCAVVTSLHLHPSPPALCGVHRAPLLQGMHAVPGRLLLVNTMEGLRRLDKGAALQQVRPACES